MSGGGDVTELRASSFTGDSGNLDLIRAAAVILVTIAHLHDIILESTTMMMWRLGQLGVIIFFVHTSFVLMLSLERTERRGESHFVDFYTRRFFRIYPLSMFCVTLSFLLNVSPTRAVEPPNWTWFEYATNMALTVNLTYSRHMVGALWTLPIEVQMYLMLPFLFLLARRAMLSVLFGVWGLAMVAGYLQPEISQRINVLQYAPCFVAGVISWRLSLTGRRSVPGWLWPLAFFALWSIFLIATREEHLFFRWAFCIALAISLPLFQEMKLGALNRGAHLIAKYSYGIYLSHIAIALFSFRNTWSAAVQWPVFLVGLTVVSVLFYNVIEAPMIRAGNRLVTWRRSRAEAYSPTPVRGGK